MSQTSDSDRERRIDALLAEYMRRCDEGEDVDPAELALQDPDIAEEFLEILHAGTLVDSMAGPAPRELSPGEQVKHFGETLPFSSKTGAPGGAAREIYDSASSLAPGPFANYELLQVVGRGGMGVVFTAQQRGLDRLVAVKMILSGRLAGDEEIQRFQQEAQAAARLSHPGIVTIHEVGESDGYHFFSMDYVDGVSLEDHLRQEKVSPRRAAELIGEIAQAIHFAHQCGVLHRDIKPGNVLLDSQGRVKITDFGLAKCFESEAALTVSGMAVGTPAYMAPEQARGSSKDVGPHSDVYSLGAMLYEMLAGRPPFVGQSVLDILVSVMHKAPDPPSAHDPDCDPALEAVCMKCLQKRPEGRYQSAEALAEDLDRYLRGKPVEARPITSLGRWRSWVGDVPLIAAALGRPVVDPTPAHRWTQWLTLAAMALLVMTALAWMVIPAGMPGRLRISTGMPGGMYQEVGEAIQAALSARTERRVAVLPSEGSVENRQRLTEREAELAILQSSAVTTNDVAAVAPLYHEVVHLVVRAGAGVKGINDLAGRAVSLGPPGSGMRLSSLSVLRAVGISVDDLQRTTAPFTELSESDTLDAALVTTGLHNSSLTRLLKDDRFHLAPLRDNRLSRYLPSFHPFTIEPSHYPAADLPEAGVQTLALPAFLAVRRDAPDILVTETLEALYASDHMATLPGFVSREDAARWPALPLHPAARAWYRQGEF